MHETIEEYIQEAMSELDWDLFSNHSVAVKPMQKPFRASIDFRWDISLSVNPGLQEFSQEVTRDKGLTEAYERPLYNIIRGLMAHERGHWRVCPFDWDPFEDIVNGVSRALQEEGITTDTNEFWPLLRTYTGTFEDLIVNAVNATSEDCASAYSKDFPLIRLIEQEYGQQRLGIPETFRAMAENGLYQMDPAIKERLQEWHEPEARHYTDELTQLYEELLEDTGVAKRAMKGKLTPQDLTYIGRTLQDSSQERWYNKAKHYTHTMHRLPGSDNEEDQSQADGPGSPFLDSLLPPMDSDGETGDQQGGGNQGQGYDTPQEPEGPQNTAADEGEQDEGGTSTSHANGQEGFDDQQGGDSQAGQRDESGMDTPRDGENKGSMNPAEADDSPDKEDGVITYVGKDEGDAAQESDKTGSERDAKAAYTHTPSPSVIERLVQLCHKKGNRPAYATRLEELMALYEERAEEIIISYQDPSKEGEKLRIADVTHEQADAESLNIRRIEWPRTRIYDTPHGRDVTFYQGDIPLTIEDPVEKDLGEIPDLAFIVDSSGSMEADLMNGYGPFDLLQRAQFSLYKWIERTGKLYHMNTASINFSDKTYYSGWKSYEDIDEVKRLNLHFEDGWHTHIDPDTIRRLYREKENPFLAILTTDGGFQQRGPVVEALHEMVEDGNSLSIIHIGGYMRNEHARRFLDDMEDIAQINRLDEPGDIIGLQLGYGFQYWGEMEW